MSNEKPMEPTPADELAKTKKPGDIQLSEGDLKEVVGGLYLKVDPILSNNNAGELTTEDLDKVTGGVAVPGQIQIQATVTQAVPPPTPTPTPTGQTASPYDIATNKAAS